MESFCKNAKDNEKIILQQYIDRCAPVYGIIIVISYFTTFVAVCHPLYTADSFPTYAKYPFDINYQPLKTIIYVNQSVVGFQFSSMLCVSGIVALLLWFTTARFEMLCNELRKVSTVYELRQCIQTHQQLLQ